ncbi:MAG: hypothetical protein K2Y35_01510 [Burkholderiales bacterium]|nr:hypothetical protein [Burkholderiales bacterium]
MRTPTLFVLALLAACSTTTSDRTANPSEPPEFPLKPCTPSTGEPCVIRATPHLVDDPDAERGVRPRKLDVRFLELWDAKVRDAICAAEPAGRETCMADLAALNEYLNPGGKRPPPDAIGVALEGGGSKSAPFTLGVLAGLHEANLFKEKRVGAVSSVSGGSYAASFLFNRLWDMYSLEPPPTGEADACRHPPQPPLKAALQIKTRTAGDFDDWFRSCVPDAYTRVGGPLDRLSNTLPLCGELRGHREENDLNEFHEAYRYQGHVWRYPDLLFGDDMAMLKQDTNPHFPEAAQTAGLTVASAGTVPLQLLSRTLFRWPINTAPTKNVYRYGLERQFGFSPEDWRDAKKLGANMTEISAQRRHDRTLACLGKLLEGRSEPTWILNSSTPGPLTVVDWITTAQRNPLINSFELTATGYGSGLYGYAKMPPRFRFELDGYHYTPRDMSMTDGVVASAAFFDDNQSLFSEQPTRFIMGFVQYLLNLTWFTEIPNYNTKRSDRVARNVTPYPFWGIPAGDKHTSAYIHLQDGGNSENSGIFALLRRGYRTVVFAHGTDDRQALFPSLCHLKNVLEAYGAYRIDSNEFHDVATALAKGNVNPFKPDDRDPDHVFRNYLDQLCSYELDESARAHFGSELADHVSPLSRLYCHRLQYPDAATTVCPRYRQRFPANRSNAAFDVPKRWADPERMFFRWTGTRFDLQVRRTRDCPLDRSIEECPRAEVLSTIIVITPAIAWTDLKPQLSGSSDIERARDWKALCTTAKPQSTVSIKACAAPPYKARPENLHTSMDTPIPCTAAAYLLSDACRPDGQDYAETNGFQDHKQRPGLRVVPETYVPEFPQDNFIWTTWNSSYLMFAAYFDLGRHYARRATMKLPPAAVDGLPPFTTDRNPP